MNYSYTIRYRLSVTFNNARFVNATSYVNDFVRIRAPNIVEALIYLYEHILKYNTMKTYRYILSVESWEQNGQCE